jgi:hypothetical protein
MTRSFAHNKFMTRMIELYCAQRARVAQRTAGRVFADEANRAEGDNRAN